MTGLLIVLTLISVWLIILSIVVIVTVLKIRKLTQGVGGGDLLRVLKKILKTQDLNAKEITEIQKHIDQMERSGKFHIQKIALVRFNPFEEIGGDHSFSVALLNFLDDGLIITGLHTRDRTRVYIKEILKGKSRLELSEEEQKALKKAQKSN